MDPLRDPGAVGVKVTESVQLAAADTVLPQSSVSAKSPLAAIDEIDRGELPMFLSRTVCARLVEPTVWRGYRSEDGFTTTDGAEFGPILSTKASVPPAS